jgi:hypothetical protein
MGIETYGSMVFSWWNRFWTIYMTLMFLWWLFLVKPPFGPFRPWDRPKWSSVYLWGRGCPSPAILVESPPHLRFRTKSGILHNTTRRDPGFGSSYVRYLQTSTKYNGRQKNLITWYKPAILTHFTFPINTIQTISCRGSIHLPGWSRDQPEVENPLG